jgi:hypothetical protein
MPDRVEARAVSDIAASDTVRSSADMDTTAEALAAAGIDASFALFSAGDIAARAFAS